MKYLIVLVWLSLFTGMLFSQETLVDTDDTLLFYVIEEKPEFPGGQDALLTYIAKNTMYPDSAKENGIEGKVFISFVINKEGYVTRVKTIRSVHPLLDNEAVRVIESLPQWKPGKQRGQYVNVQFQIPINFTLKKDK
jgi:TonB family protein